MKPSQDQSCQLEVVAALVVLLSQERKCECMSQCIGHSGACPRISLIGLSLLAAGGTMYTACTSQALESGFMNLPPVANSIALELHNVPMLEPQELKRLLVQYCIDCCSCPLVFSLWEYVGPTLDRLDRGVQLEPNGSPSRSSVGLANDNTALSTTQQNTKCI